MSPARHPTPLRWRPSSPIPCDRVYATLSAVAPLFPPLKAIVDALVAGDLDGIKGTLTDHAQLLKVGPEPHRPLRIG